VGRQTTEQIRREVGELQNAERAELVARAYRWNQDVANSRFGISLITAFNVVLLIAVYLYASRELVQRDRARRRLLQSQRMLEAEVRERTMELSALSSDLQRLQEEEKSKLARELHDEMGSILVSAKMDVSWALTRIRDTHPQCAEKLARALMVLDDGVQVKRRIVDDLRPALLDNLGLGAAIAWHAEQMSERSGLHCQVSVPEEEAPLSSDAAIALFRIVQEALTNVVRHAKATNAWIELQHTAHNVVLTVRDDGVGLPAETYRTLRAHGIASMRQRVLGAGGEFEIKGERGKGTRIQVVMPLREEALATKAEGGSDA
jgi:signal transduction histidine kinase